MDKPSGAKILLGLREGTIQDWRSLCAYFGQSPDERNSMTFWIAEALQELQQAGMVEFEGAIDPPSFVFPSGEIRITPAATVTQHAMGVSLPDAARMKRGVSMVVEPFFGVYEVAENDRTDLFMLMPFSDELLPVYTDHVKKVVAKEGFEIRRGDDFFTSHEIMKDVWKSIVGSRAVIAECTGRNPNVFYEIEIAHAVGRPVILITQDETDVPFDLRAIRYIKYDFTPLGMKEFERTLKATVVEVMS